MADCLWNQRHLRVLPGSPGTLFVVTARAVWRMDVASGTVEVVSRYEGGGRSATTCVRLGRATVVVACFDGMLRWISADGTHGAFGAGIDGPTSVAAAGDDVFVQAASGLHRVSLRTEKGRRAECGCRASLGRHCRQLGVDDLSREVMLADVTAAACARRVWSYGAHREVAAWSVRGGMRRAWGADVCRRDRRLDSAAGAGLCRRGSRSSRPGSFCVPPRVRPAEDSPTAVFGSGDGAVRPARWFHPTRAQLAWLSRSDRTLVRDLPLLRRRLCAKAGLLPLPPELWTLVCGFVLAGDRGAAAGRRLNI